MQYFRSLDLDATPVGWGVRVAILAAADAPGAEPLMRQLAGLGASVDRFDETFEALGALIDDPAGYGLFVMLCDGLGGMEDGLRAFHLLGVVRERVAVIMVGTDCSAQTFPETRDDPIRLRAPLSAVALRVGMEHALRDRLFWAAA